MSTDTRSGAAPGRLAPRRPAHHEPRYAWWALSVTSLGMLMATVNSGTLLIALPDVERALHVSLLTLVWVMPACHPSASPAARSRSGGGLLDED